MARGSYDIATVGGAIDALGAAWIAETTGRSPQAVSNWRAQKRIASDLFHLMASELERRGLSADPALWGQEIAREQAA